MSETEKKTGGVIIWYKLLILERFITKKKKCFSLVAYQSSFRPFIWGASSITLNIMVD